MRDQWLDGLGKLESLKALYQDNYEVLSQDKSRILVFTNDAPVVYEVMHCLGRRGCLVYRASNYEAGLDYIQEAPDSIDLLVFDMDLPPDVQVGVDTMVKFRANFPGIPVLLLSCSVQRDEFSDHRRAIGDATLRKPISCVRLLEGIAAVGENFAARP